MEQMRILRELYEVHKQEKEEAEEEEGGGRRRGKSKRRTSNASRGEGEGRRRSSASSRSRQNTNVRSTTQWQCGHCTLVNAAGTYKCEACDNPYSALAAISSVQGDNFL